MHILENENPGVNHEHSSRIAEGYNLIEAPPGNADVLVGSLGSKSRRGRRRSQGAFRDLTIFLKWALLKEDEALTETVPTLPV